MRMNNNRDVIIALCSYLSKTDELNPLTPSEYSDLSSRLIDKKINLTELLTLDDEGYKELLGYEESKIQRIQRLLERSASLSFEIEKLERIGIKIVTRADRDYPKMIKDKLGRKCPPLFYYVGNLNLLNKDIVSFVGSRHIDDHDISLTESLVNDLVKRNFVITSGGAKGVDRTATEKAICIGASAIEFVSDSMIKRIRDINVVNAIRDERMLIVSHINPSAGFSIGEAMARNKYIYCSSFATIVIKSDENKGGTWAGAVEALKNKYDNVYCVYNDNYSGNKKLIEMGAKRLDSIDDFEM